MTARVLNRPAAYAGGMTAVAPASAPTREDAERAAEVLMSAGVAAVLLFGSVAADISAPTWKPTALTPCWLPASAPAMTTCCQRGATGISMICDASSATAVNWSNPAPATSTASTATSRISAAASAGPSAPSPLTMPSHAWCDCSRATPAPAATSPAPRPAHPRTEPPDRRTHITDQRPDRRHRTALT